MAGLISSGGGLLHIRGLLSSSSFFLGSALPDVCKSAYSGNIGIFVEKTSAHPGDVVVLVTMLSK